MKCDAIVNATNTHLSPNGIGVDASIHNAAGQHLLSATKKIGRVGIGTAVITPAFNLPSKYVIHTAGPVWIDGFHGEQILLKSCYTNALAIALEHECNSIAFPLISAGNFHFPKDRVLSIALQCIVDFLYQHYEIDVYLVIFDKYSYQISTQLYSDITSYINDNYVEENKVELRNLYPALNKNANTSRKTPSLDEQLKNIGKSFALMLMTFIDKKNLDHIVVYKNANVSKQTWFKILNDETYHPNKTTVISFAISLKLNIEETNLLLNSAGFTLSNNNKFDIIIKYFIEQGNYNVHKINEVLFSFDQCCLGC